MAAAAYISIQYGRLHVQSYCWCILLSIPGVPMIPYGVCQDSTWTPPRLHLLTSSILPSPKSTSSPLHMESMDPMRTPSGVEWRRLEKDWRWTPQGSVGEGNIHISTENVFTMMRFFHLSISCYPNSEIVVWLEETISLTRNARFQTHMILLKTIYEVLLEWPRIIIHSLVWGFRSFGQS